MTGHGPFPHDTDPQTLDSLASTARPDISWKTLYAALAPALGARALMDIYRMCLRQAAAEYPWLTTVAARTRTAADFSPLVEQLGEHDAGVAAEVHETLLHHFARHLESLLGVPLARRVLESIRAPDGTFPCVHAMPVPTSSEIGEQLALSALRARASERDAQRELAQVRDASERDALTGLANRNRMFDRLDSAIALARRTRTPAAVLFVDLDGFKAFNDDLGHAVGDRILTRVARMLVGAVRETDTVCRYGGDEFVVVLTPMEEQSEAGPAARRISQAVAGSSNGDRKRLSASVGIAIYPGDGADGQALLMAADRSMYQGRNETREALTDA